jgi:hypothetical protein
MESFSMRRLCWHSARWFHSLDRLQPAEAVQHFAHYNLVHVHRSLRVTPAMAAEVESRLWTLQELVEETSR